jgi:hypothetical protein
MLEAQRIERNYWANIEAEKALERGASNYERYGDIGQSNTTWEQRCAQDLEDLKRENIAPLFKELTDAAAKEAEEKKRKKEGKGERGNRGFFPDEMAPVEDELDPKNFPPRMGRKNVERPLQKLPVVRQKKEAKRSNNCIDLYDEGQRELGKSSEGETMDICGNGSEQIGWNIISQCW